MITGVFGLPRSGKTTYLAKIAKGYLKKGVPVYSNFALHGCYKLDFSKLGKENFHDCVILIDEISLICDSRDWKDFTSDLRYFFTNHGHYKCDVIYCSQWYTDTDVKIRRMTENLYYIQRFPFGFSMRYEIIRDISSRDNGEIYDTFSFKHGRLFYRPLYYKLFDSFSRKELPEVENVLWENV
jgi:hypothetical protein